MGGAGQQRDRVRRRGPDHGERGVREAAHRCAALGQGDRFVHESYIGSRFIGRVEEQVQLAGHPAIVPSIEGSARATGMNTLWIDDADPFWRGFQVI